MRQLWLVDTSVLCELIEVPGKSRGDGVVRAEFETLAAGGDRFIIPVTTVIETGNHVEQAGGDRRAAAERLANVVSAAAEGREPFEVNRVTWDTKFLDSFLAGDSTGESFVDLSGSGRLGGGDIAILVERDQYLAASGYDRDRVRIWTLETTLGAYA